MNIIDAIRSGKKFKRPKWDEYDFRLQELSAFADPTSRGIWSITSKEDGDFTKVDIYLITKEDILADDYYLEENGNELN